MRYFIKEIKKCENCDYFSKKENGKCYCSRASTPSIIAYIDDEEIPKWCPLPYTKNFEDYENGYDKIFIRKDFLGSEILF